MTKTEKETDMNKYEAQVRGYSDEELDKEVAFARGFGAFDELSADWIAALDAEAKRRGRVQ